MAEKQISDPRDLFLEELGDILYVERKLAKSILPRLEKEIRDKEFKQGVHAHLEQTKGHAEKVEQAFEKLGEKPKAEKCPGLEGLEIEHDEMIAEVSPELRDAVNTGAVARTEHYEIAAYQGLVTMAQAMGESEVVSLLRENLKDERETLKQVERVSKRLSKQMVKELATA